MDRALYIHGFGSAFKEHSDKVKALKKHFEVIPFSYDSGGLYQDNLDAMQSTIQNHEIKLVVGTSLGGFYAIQLANSLDIMSVALNPAHTPKKTLKAYIGDNVNFETGKPFNLSPENVLSYPDQCTKNGHVLTYLMEDDELLNSRQTYHDLKDHFACTIISGGTHRFSGLDQYMNEIVKAFNSWEPPKIKEPI